jgi:hypothetical protein
MRGSGKAVFILLGWLLAAQLAFAQWPEEPARRQSAAGRPDEAEQLFAMGNQARATVGVRPLQWDAALAMAALAHCRRMAAEGPIAHRYNGEPDLGERTAAAGAHFSLIEENVAAGPTALAMHSGWMHSPGHRSNLLNPEVDRVGVAVVSANGTLYAVADYEHLVQQFTQVEVEARVAAEISARGVRASAGSAAVHAACASEHGIPHGEAGEDPGFVMRWQDAEPGRLPDALVAKLTSRRYHRAEVASCPANGQQGSFTVYRLAVLLY